MEEKKDQTNSQEQSENDFLLEQVTEDARELEQYVKEFSEFLPLPMALITPAKNIVDVNNAFRKLFGYNEIEVIGQQLDFIFENKRDVDRLFDHLEKYGEIKQLETEVITKEHTQIPVSVSASHRKDNEGNVVGYFVAFSDIQDFKKLQDNLEDKVKDRTKELEKMQKVLLDTLDEMRQAKDRIEIERNKTAGIVSNFPDPVIMVDNEWRIMLLNPAAKKTFALTENNLGQKINRTDDRFSFDNFKKIIKVDYLAKEMETDKKNRIVVEEVILSPKTKIAAKENPFSAAYSGIKEGSVVYKVLTASVYDENRTCHGHMKIFFDLTREKLVDKMKSEFVSIAAHQLRTPLSAIKWAIKLVLDEEMGGLNEMQKKTLTKGYISNERIIKLVNDMLDVSRIEEGRFGYDIKVASVGDALAEAVESIESQIKEKKIKFSVSQPDKMPLVKLDKKRFVLALQNILENAVAYTPELGQVDINVTIDKKNLVLAVKDSGVGIPAEDMSKLFTKFFRAANVVRMQTDGSGLGLFIAKNIIIKHGGTIKCQSEEGKGTEMIITLPCV